MRVHRATSWTAPIDDPDFWNPKLRAPICFNAAAASSYLPRIIKKTDLILAGRTKAQMMEAIVAACCVPQGGEHDSQGNTTRCH
jgi:hypothetical protein